MFTRILVPLDGSTRAERSIPVAAHIARATGGTIVLIQVVALPFTYSPYLGSATFNDKTIEAALKAVESYLDTLAHSEPLAGIKTATQAILGSAAPEILSTANAYHIDLIVMTSRGRTGLQRWTLGSVAQILARHSSMPVLVLHEKGPLPVRPQLDHRPLHALVALDGSALAKATLEPAAQLVSALAAPAQGSLHLLRVVSDQESMECVKENKLHLAKTYLRSIVAQLREGSRAHLNLPITWSVAIADDVAHAIIHMAENGEDAEGAGVFGRCDLIAMATHGRSGLHHWALGSITERVLGATKLPILIVRPEEAEFKRALDGGETREALISTR